MHNHYTFMVACLASIGTITVLHSKDFHLLQGIEYQSEDETQEVFARLQQPITMSAAGISSFLKNSYNDPLYAREFLPNNFSHFHQLLTHGLQTKQSRTYVQSIMRLFTNKLKGCTYINAYVFDAFLETMPALLTHHVTTLKIRTGARLKLNDILYANFINRFQEFKQDPQTFFHDLSDIILDEIDHVYLNAGAPNVDELRKTLLIFLELGLAKLVWSPQDSTDSWDCVKRIASSLATLFDTTIIADAEDLNALYISLTERYCYFLELAAPDLPLAFFDAIKKDITTSSLPMFEVEEQEEHIEKKSHRLIRSIMHAEARCRAYHYPTA